MAKKPVTKPDAAAPLHSPIPDLPDESVPTKEEELDSRWANPVTLAQDIEIHVRQSHGAASDIALLKDIAEWARRKVTFPAADEEQESDD